LPEHDLEQEPEHNPLHREDSGEGAETHVFNAEPNAESKPAVSPLSTQFAVSDAPYFDPQNPELQNYPPMGEQPMFQSFYQPQIRPSVRIPHLGHLAILAVFALFGLLCASVLIRSALYFHLFGVTSLQKAITEIHYTLGSEAVLYLFTFGACALFFPLIWHKGFFAGLQWNSAIALRLRKQLFLTAAICFVLALVDSFLLPGPTDAPIDKIFRTPGAAWLLFAFGVTLAPFFEEMIFRGFLLPALCTACDWINEKTTGASVRPLDENGQPQWSLNAMAIASVLTSLPFAGMHAAQTGYSLGPFLLLVGVSLVLCWARLSTRSLAASVMVHASYNFLLFSMMMLGTGGFRHLERM
jgi:membrane protease YdiL (CAAX protease family)